MVYTPYYYKVAQGPSTRIRVWLNDVPFYRSYDVESNSCSGPAIHLLVPGENTFAIEIDCAPAWTVVSFSLVQDPRNPDPVFDFAWPRDAAVPDKGRLPFRFEAKFQPPGDLFSPVHLAAPLGSVPCEGTPDLREAVRRFQAALEQRDVDAYCEALALKASEFERAYPGSKGVTAAELRVEMERFFAQELRVRPLDLNYVHFEPRAGGRIVHARHLSFDTLVEAVSAHLTPEGLGDRVAVDLTFTRHQGAWKIFL